MYSNELSQAEKLVLDNQRNKLNQIQRTTRFLEMAACCQRLPFACFSPDKADDITHVLRHNTQENWKFTLKCLAVSVVELCTV